MATYPPFIFGHQLLAHSSNFFFPISDFPFLHSNIRWDYVGCFFSMSNKCWLSLNLFGSCVVHIGLFALNGKRGGFTLKEATCEEVWSTCATRMELS